MINIIKNLFKRNKSIVRWVDNTEMKYPHLEAKRFLLVEDENQVPMLLTEHEVNRSKKRALKNLEDTSWKK